MPPKPSSKKGPPPALLAKLKQHLAAEKSRENEEKKRQEENERRLREELKLAAEQRKYEEEQKKIEKEKKKMEEAMKLAERKKEKKGGDVLARMKASGMILPDVERIRMEEEEEKKKKKKEEEEEMKNGGMSSSGLGNKQKSQLSGPPHGMNAIEKKKREQEEEKRRRKKEEEEEEEEEEFVDDCVEQSEATESGEEIDEDDWEALMARDERREERKSRNESIRQGRRNRKAAFEEEKLRRKKEKALQKEAEEEKKQSQKAKTNFRSPICCVLGHVDTGKTSLLDRIRATNVQKGEAGGITQQIGATFFPSESLNETTKVLRERKHIQFAIPGLLMIDTPGHESFSNLRSRGSSICDIAVLVVDIMHGLQPQTIESIHLLREKKCPFIIALNKIDRLFGWVAHENMDSEQTLSKQSPRTIAEFDERLKAIQLKMAEQGFNSALYYQNTDLSHSISIVPTSARTGEGICDLLLLKIQLAERFMKKKILYRDDLECIVLEVNTVTGYGFTVDVILINGELHEKDNIILSGQQGPIISQIRSLLTPQPLRESRVKGEFIHHKSITAAMGVKIAANDLEYAIPGTSLLVYHNDEERERFCEEITQEKDNIFLNYLNPNGVGVLVQSSTLGSLEALLIFLKNMKIPVSNIAIGPLHKKNAMLAIAMKRKEPRYAQILAFDVHVTDEARELAAKNEIPIFEANIIYHLFDRFTEFVANYERDEMERLKKVAIFPVVLRVIGSAFRRDDPMIIPVRVEEGQLRPDTPLCVIKASHADSSANANVIREVNPLGKVISIEKDNKPVTVGKQGNEYAVKIHSSEVGAQFGRTVHENDQVYSLISRTSVNAIKKFKSELSPEDVELLASLIKMLNVPK